MGSTPILGSRKINKRPLLILTQVFNFDIIIIMSLPKIPRKKCVNCGKEPARARYKYCSNTCQQKYQSQLKVKEWKSGKVSGLQSLGIVSTYIKRYLREKFGDRCCLCGWAEINPKTGVVPLVADHIDGNWRNNVESNLRLICPNCDALSPTYSGLNRGNGRKNRAPSKRTREWRLLFKKSQSSSVAEHCFRKAGT